jgi:hypothetical protein
MKIGDSEILITLEDIKALFLRNKKKIYAVTALAFLLAFGSLFVLSKPQYKAEAYFQQAANKTDEKSIFAGLLLGGQTNTSSAASLMTTHVVIKTVVEKEGMQFSFKRSFLRRLFGRIRDNINLRVGHDIEPIDNFDFRNTSYDGYGTSFYLSFVNKGLFEVLDERQVVIAKGKLNEPVVLSNVCFTLINQPKFVKLKKAYKINVSFWFGIADDLIKRINIVPKKNSPNILLLSCEDRNRDKAVSILDDIMAAYISYLKNDNEDFRKNQFAYLDKKQQELNNSFEQSLNDYVSYLNDCISKKGFINLGHESTSLFEPQQKYLSKMFEVDLEKSRVDHALHNEGYNISAADKKIGGLEQEIADLQQRKDILDLSMQMQGSKNMQVSKLNEINHKLDDINFNLKKIDSKTISWDGLDKNLLKLKQEADEYFKQKSDIEFNFKKIEKAELLKNRLSSLQEVRFVLNNVENLLNIIKKEDRIPSMIDFSFDKDGRVKLWLDNFRDKKDLCQFLDGYVHNLKLKEQSLVEGNFYIEKLPQEFSSLDLVSAQGLSQEYCCKLDQIELKRRQIKRVIDAMKDNSFEMSSLTEWFNDAISIQLLKKASDLRYRDYDRGNYNDKDIRKSSTELAVIKSFFEKRLEEVYELNGLDKELLDEKIIFLKEVMLDRINQKISLLKEAAQSYLVGLKQNLNGEKELLEEKLKDLQDKMKDIPQRWRKEKLLNLKAEMSLAMMKSMTEVIEAKSVSHNLTYIGSKPLLQAIAPLSPSFIDIKLYSLLFALFSGFCTFIFYAIYEIFKGIPLSLEYLSVLQYPTCGHLKLNFLNSMRMVMRRITHQVVVCYRRKGVNYIDDLLLQFSRKDKKLLVIEVNKDGKDEEFMRYLKKDIKSLPIDDVGGVDKIFLNNDTILSPAFKTALLMLKDKYDLLLIVADINAANEGEDYLDIAEQAVFVLKEEKKHDLSYFFEWADDKGKLIFVKE